MAWAIVGGAARTDRPGPVDGLEQVAQAAGLLGDAVAVELDDGLDGAAAASRAWRVRIWLM